jgi:multidrug transporter EmrE-like cation transporter
MKYSHLSSLSIVLSVFFQSASVVFGKQGAVSLNAFTFSNIIQNHFYLLSLVCLACQAVTWQLVLRKHPLFWAYLWMSLVYIVIIVAGHFIFKESITIGNIIGSLMIISGIIIINS